MDTAQLIKELGIENLPAEQQENILEGFNLTVGNKILESLTEQQQNEYQAIIDADQDVIDAWLEQNAPEYKDSPLYQGIASDRDNPERIDAAKVFASLEWTRLNVQNIAEIVAATAAEYKAQLTNTGSA